MILDKSTINEFDKWHETASLEGGAALIFKEKDWTSFDCVAKLRGMTKIKKVGHAGTLDPLAEGLLILCFGKWTKKIEEFQAQEKRYTGIVKIGAVTKTEDAEAEEEDIKEYSHISENDIIETIKQFIGKIEQIPPMYSAKKIGGKKLYELARKNQIIELKPSQIEIFNIDIIEIKLPYITLDILCSKGTYIRSLARDIGAKLGTGGYLSGLVRTGIGNFKSEDALKISDISNVFAKE